MIFLSNLNLNKNELQNARIQNLASDPANPVAGQFWFNTGTNEIKYYDGSNIIVVPKANLSFEDNTANLKANGVAALGTSGKIVNSDHVHPTDESRLAAKPDGANSLITAQNKIDTRYIPDSILGQLEYKGTFNASAQGTITGLEKGWYYIASTAGSYNPDGTAAGASYAVGDWAVYNGSAWDKIDNTDAVTMVNSQIGAVETYKGSWAASTSYYKGDIVKQNGILYICNASHTSGASFDASKWDACGSTYLAGTGLSLSGSTFNHSNAVTAQATQAVYPITIDAEGHIASYGNAITFLSKFVGTITGNGSSTDFVLNHNLNTKDICVSVYNSSDEKVIVDADSTSANSATIKFAAAPTSSTTYRVVIIG